MRIDKFLKVSRLLKRRTAAQEACGASKVSVNGKAVKPSQRLKEGDIVTIEFSQSPLTVKILRLTEHAKKDEAATMYEVIGE